MSERTFRIENASFDIGAAEIEGGGFQVASTPRSYDVVWRGSLQEVVRDVTASLAASPANFLLIDRNVFDLFFRDAEIDARQLYLLDAVEENKKIETVLDVISRIQALSPSKNNLLTVIGGGITQDIGAFAGCVYKRGFPWRFLPTTLLSMCDSCIGGKTGINYRGGKNQLGLFSAPRRVEICPEFLTTLAERDMISGYGEILKLLVTGGRAMVGTYADACDPGTGLPRTERLKELILGALAVKKAVIERDEFELDLRRSLNYGHTFGHAIEVMSDYRIPHGTAVALGIVAINRLGVVHGITLPEAHREVSRLAAPLLRGISLDAMDWNRFGELLQKDKKTECGSFVFVLIRDLGETVFSRFPKTGEPVVEITQAVIGSVLEAHK